MPEVLYQVSKDRAVQRGLIVAFCNEIPLLLSPGAFVPPFTAYQPWPIRLPYRIAAPTKLKARRSACLNCYQSLFRWVYMAKTYLRCSGTAHSRIVRWQRKCLNVEAVDGVRIFQHSAANVVVAHQRSDACQRDIEAAWFRQLRREQAELNLAGRSRLGMKTHTKNLSCRRVSFEIKVQQLQPQMLVIGWDTGRHGTAVCAAILQSEIDGH